MSESVLYIGQSTQLGTRLGRAPSYYVSIHPVWTFLEDERDYFDAVHVLVWGIDRDRDTGHERTLRECRGRSALGDYEASLFYALPRPLLGASTPCFGATWPERNAAPALRRSDVQVVASDPEFNSRVALGSGCYVWLMERDALRAFSQRPRRHQCTPTSTSSSRSNP
jgi:hypothetical protein